MTSHEKITDWNSQNLQAIFFIDPFYEFPPSYRLDIWWVGLINVSSIYCISLKIHPISNPNKNFLIILHRNRNIYSKIYTEPQKVPGRQKKKSWIKWAVLERLTFCTSTYITNKHWEKQYGTGRKTFMKTNGSKVNTKTWVHEATVI